MPPRPALNGVVPLLLAVLTVANIARVVTAQTDPANAGAVDNPADDDEIMREIRAQQEQERQREEQRKYEAHVAAMEAQSLKQKYDEEQFERLQLGIFGVELPRPVAEVTLPFVTARGNENLQAIMRDGEDAASATARFCERHKLLGEMIDPQALETTRAHLVHVATSLNDLAARHGYASPELDRENRTLSLKTAGAYKKRAAESAKEGDFDMAAADLLRALMRPGLDEDVTQQLTFKLHEAIRELKKKRAAEQAEREKEEQAERRRKAEEDAQAEARERRLKEEADWVSFANELVTAHAVANGEEGNANVAGGLSLTLTPGTGDPAKEVYLAVREGQDTSHAAFDFCAAHGLHSADDVVKLEPMLREKLERDAVAFSPRPPLTASAFVAAAKTAAKLGDFAAAGADFSRAMHTADIGAGDLEAARAGVVEMMQALAFYGPFLDLFVAKRWKEALEMLEKVRSTKGTAAAPWASSAKILLIEAKCAQQLGLWSAVQRAAARSVEVAADYTPWQRGQPRMLGVSLGVQSAMELGSPDKALKFYQKVLQYDPEQAEVKAQYKRLKNMVKMLETVDKHLAKSFNHKAVAALDELLSELRGMEIDSSVFRSAILLKLCRAQANVNRHEEALANCQQAYDVLTVDRSAGFFISPVKKREALEARSEAYMNDKNYDEAVNDLRGALELAGGDEKKTQEIQRKLQEAQNKATLWKCVDPEGDAASWDPHRCGHPSQGNGRDHLAVLELPANLPEVSQEKQCEWLKKQHKKHAIKWHPDKCKGNMQRCSRKMNEASEAKSVLQKRFGCKNIR